MDRADHRNPACYLVTYSKSDRKRVFFNMALYENLTPDTIAKVLQVKLGPKFQFPNPPKIELVDTPKGTERIFKVMIATGREPRRHFFYFVSRLTGKDMDDWLDNAVRKIKVYTVDPYADIPTLPPL